MKITSRTKWWTLIWGDGSLDIDADNQLHLYPTREAALEEARTFIDGSIPKPIQIKLSLVT